MPSAPPSTSKAFFVWDEPTLKPSFLGQCLAVLNPGPGLCAG